MVAWDLLVGPERAGHLAAALLHTLWQGLIAAAVVYWGLRRIPARRAGLRYGLALAALAGVLAAGMATFAVLEYQPPAPEAVTVAERAHAGQSVVAGPVVSIAPGRASDAPPMPGPSVLWQSAVSVWAGGVMLMLARAGWLLVGAGRLRRQCRLIDDEPRIAQLVDELRAALRIARCVQVAAAEHVRVPAVLGVIWPIVLLPASMASGVPTDQLRMVLAHELAHVRRWDYLVNLLQLLIEAILFFNPAVWWISRQVRIEREACADALAAAATGQGGADYARTLAGVLEAMFGPHGIAPASAAWGLDGGQQHGGLLDRVRRLVLPEHRPQIRLPWYSLLAALLLGGVVLLGLWCGTQVAVAAAAELLTPQERIEKLQQAARDYGVMPPARREGQQEALAFAGTVRTADGAPLPARALVHLFVEYVAANGGSSSLMTSIGVRDGRFSYALPSGTTSVACQVEAEGYAVAKLGLLAMVPGQPQRPLEVVLERGFAGHIRMLDPQGNPIGGAKLAGSFPLVRGSYSWSISLTSDASGIATVAHCSNHPLMLEVKAEGYQHDRDEAVQISPDKPFVWTLHPARPTSGRVVSRETGQPVAGATLKLVRLNGPWSSGGGPWHAPVWATTGQDGRFTLANLRDDGTYAFAVEAEGHAPLILRPVLAGQRDLIVELGSEIVLRGKVVGDLSSIAGKDGIPRISCDNPVQVGDGLYSHPQPVSVTVRDGVGYFDIRNLYQGSVTLSAGAMRLPLELSASKADVVLDLSQSPPRKPHRTVVFRLQVPHGWPSPTGSLRYSAQEAEHVHDYGRAAIDQNGDARVELPVPNVVYLEPAGLVGYWFSPISGLSIPAGEGEFVVPVATLPAGAIYGRVLDPDGKLADGFGVSAVAAERPPKVGGSSLSGGSGLASSSGAGRFVASPLPLGGTYHIVASRRQSFVVSPPIRVDEQHPTHEIELRFVEGKTVSGQVLDAAGNPVPAVAVAFSYQLSHLSHGFSFHPDPLTDSQGRFRFDGINPDVPGEYRLDIVPERDFQPAAIQVKPDDSPFLIRLRPGRVVRGVLLDDATGAPLAGARVKAYSGEAPHRGPIACESPTNDRGEFRFSNLGPYRYVVAADNGRIVDDTPIPIEPQDQPLVLRFRKW